MSTYLKSTGLPIGEVKPLKPSIDSDFGCSLPSALNMSSPNASFDVRSELPIMADSTDEELNGRIESYKYATLPKSDRQAAESRIPRPRHIKSTFLPIQKSQRASSTPRGKRTGTPLQELDRKWALQQCEELTTWTSELLSGAGKQLDKDLRNAISDGFTLPAIIEIVFERRINTLRADIELSKEERLEILAECLEYLNTVECDLTEISAADLECGDLKAILTVLATIKQTMGQQKSKPSSKRADRTKLLTTENGQSNASKPVEEEESSVSLNQDVVVVPGKHTSQVYTPRKILTTFQRPLVDNYQPSSDRPLKSIMKGSLSLDNLDNRKAATITLGRSKSHDRQRMGRRTASNVSINVDSGEQEFDDQELLPPPNQLQFRSLSVDAKRASTAYSNNDSEANRKSAFSYLSSRGRSRHDHREEDYTRLSYQTLLVRGQPSGDSNPSTPSVRDSSVKNNNSRSANQSPNDSKLPRSEVKQSRIRSKSLDKTLNKGKPVQQEIKSYRNRGRKAQPGQKSNSLESQKTSSNDQSRCGSASSDKIHVSSDGTAKERTSHRRRSKGSRQSSKKQQGEVNNNTHSLNGWDSVHQPHAPSTGYDGNPSITDSTEQMSEGVEPLVNLETYTHSPRHQPLQNSGSEANQPLEHSQDSLGRSETFTQRPSPRDRRVRQNSASTASTITPPTPTKRELTPPTPPKREITRQYSLTEVHSTKAALSYNKETVEERMSFVTEDGVYYDPVPVAVHHSTQIQSKSSVTATTDTPPPYRELTDAQLRRLSMPTGFEYKENGDHKSSTRHKGDMRQSLNSVSQERTTLDNINMEDSFYDNNQRSNTPTLPALTDNTDIESVSDMLHNRRYKRSASVSDRMLFTGGETQKTSEEKIEVELTGVKGYETENPNHVKIRRKGGSSSQPHRRSGRHRKPPHSTKPTVQKRTHSEEPSMEEKIEQLEKMFENFISVLGEDRGQNGSNRSSLAESVSSQHSAVARLARKHRHARSTENRINKKRFERIESHIMTLAKSVAHISSEMRSNAAMYAEIERLSAEVNFMKRTLETQVSLPRYSEEDKKSRTISSPVDESKHRARKLNKLTQFFGQEPPMMKFFLKELGYEKYTTKFEKSQIGMLELPYMTEEQLKSIGIPLGPRMRILQEAKDIQREIRFIEQQTINPPAANGHIAKAGKRTMDTAHSQNNNGSFNN